MKSGASTVSETWRQIVALLAELYEEEARPIMGPPATCDELSELEEHLGCQLPPSYRSFLLVHNGVRNFDGDIDLHSTKELVTLFSDGSLEDLEDEEPELATFVIAGTDESRGGYFAVDRSAPAGDELSVVHLPLNLCSYSRWASFHDMLADWLARLHSEALS